MWVALVGGEVHGVIERLRAEATLGVVRATPVTCTQRAAQPLPLENKMSIISIDNNHPSAPSHSIVQRPHSLPVSSCPSAAAVLFSISPMSLVSFSARTTDLTQFYRYRGRSHDDATRHR